MSKLHSVNKEQKLYVLTAGAGFSCYGFTVLDRKARAVLAWLTGPHENAARMILGYQGKDLASLSIPDRIGTKKHYEACQRVIQWAGLFCSLYHVRCPVGLVDQLNGLEGQRVEVVDCHGETRRFYVGKSNGWMPSHLEIARRDSSSGIAVIGAPFQSVRVVSVLY